MISETFLRLPDRKRKRIIDCAAAIMARDGFHKANVNEIAATAGISVGALYNYFDTKDDIFEAVFMDAARLVSDVQAHVFLPRRDVHEQFVALFVEAVMVARRRPSYVTVYLSLSAPGMEDFAERYATPLEEAGAAVYRDVLARGMADGALRPDLDVDATAYLIDNSLMALYASMCNAFYGIHRRVLLGQPHARVTRAWAQQVALRVVQPLWEGIRA